MDDSGTMLAEGAAPLVPPAEWKPDHLLVAALLRCSLQSLRYHAGRAGVEASGRGSGRAVVTKREGDGRYAVVEIRVALEVTLDPEPGLDAVRELLAKAERDCFVGSSLAVKPTYAWTVNGRAAPS